MTGGRTLAIAVVALVALGACGPRVIRAEVTTRSGSDATVSVVDDTGWLRTVSVPANPGLLDAGVTAASNPSSDLSVVQIAWGAGPCLGASMISIHATEPVSIDVVSSERGDVQPCGEQLLARYVVDLAFDRPVPAADVVVRDRTPEPESSG